MQDRKIRVSLEDIRDIMEEKLESGGEIMYSPKGTSMLPFIREGIDTVILKKNERDFKPGDIVFYRRPEGAFVIHRILKVQKYGRYTICGDNQWILERDVEKDSFIAVVTKLKRGEKDVNLNSLGHKIYYRLLFLRRFRLHYLNRHVAKAVLRRIKKLFGRTGK